MNPRWPFLDVMRKKIKMVQVPTRLLVRRARTLRNRVIIYRSREEIKWQCFLYQFRLASAVAREPLTRKSVGVPSSARRIAPKAARRRSQRAASASGSFRRLQERSDCGRGTLALSREKIKVQGF